MRKLHIIAAALLALGMAAIASPHPTFAATIADCPTTEAALSSDISSAGTGGTVAISCSTDTTIPFTGTYFTSSNVTLDASSSPGKVTLDGGNARELLWVNSGNTLTLIGLTLSHGSGASSGGAIENRGTLHVNGSTFSNNVAAGGGGAIDNSASTVTITNSTFSNNSTSSQGGAILNQTQQVYPSIVQGSVTIAGSTFSGNSAFDYGAIANRGIMTITGSTLTNNTATRYGGAIGDDDPLYLSHFASLTISNSTLSGNSAPGTTNTGRGGAIITGYGNATITNSTLSNNNAVQGGAIYMLAPGGGGGTVSISNSTLSGNQVHSGSLSAGGEIGGGVLYLEGGSTTTITQSTLADNSAGTTGKGGVLYTNNGTTTISNSTLAHNSAPEGAGGAIYNLGSRTHVRGTIIAHNTGGNCSLPFGYTLDDQGYNLETGTECGLTGASDLSNTSPDLKPLAHNGGPTETMALDANSKAIDTIPSASGHCPATDQRGVTRLDDGEIACDIGAYEHVDHLRIDVSLSGGEYFVHIDGATLEPGSVVDWRAKTPHGDHAGTIVVPTSGTLHALVFHHVCASEHITVDASGREVTASGVNDVTAHFEGDPC